MAYLSQTNLVLAGGQAPISTETRGFIGKGSGGSTRLDFTSVAHTKFYKDFNESDQCELSYYLKPDRKSKGRYRLVRRLDTPVDDDIEEGGREYTIAESIQELNFRYYDHTKDEWIE